MRKIQGTAEGHAPGGSLTGLVVESGDSLTTVTPIVDGFIISSGIRCSPLAGARVTCELQSLLRRQRATGPLTWARCKQLKEEQVCARPMHGGDEGDRCVWLAVFSMLKTESDGRVMGQLVLVQMQARVRTNKRAACMPVFRC